MSQDYASRLPLQRQVQDIILGHSESTSTFISRKSLDLCISRKINDEIINKEIFLRYQLSTNAMVSWFGKKHCSRVVKLVFDKDVLCKPLYIPVNENENHWILVIVFPKAKLVVSHDPLKTDFKKKAAEINVVNEPLRKKKSKHEFSVIEIRYSGWQEAAKYNWLLGIYPSSCNENSYKRNYILCIDDY